jgi:hypothetical protein
MTQRRRPSGCDGLLLIEAAVIMCFVMVLTMAVAPVVTSGVDDARVVRAKHDLTTITAGVIRVIDDVWPNRNRAGGIATYVMLVGPGAVPDAAATGSAAWLRAAGGRGVGLLNEQLVGVDEAAGPRPPVTGWRGAYLAPLVGPDPWGYRYAVNIAAISTRRMDTVAMTAGPDGRVDTAFAVDGVRPRGDDLLKLVTSGGVPRPPR